MQRKFLSSIIFSAIAACGVVATNVMAAGMPKVPPAVVTMNKIKPKIWQGKIGLIGSLSAFYGTMITPEVNGRLVKILFKSGQLIKKGQPIVQLYPDVLRAQLSGAKAGLKLAKINYGRYKKLYEKHAIDLADLDKMEAGYKKAQADVDQTAALLSQTLIKAPFSGKLGLRQVSLGDFLSPGTPVVNLQSIDPIRVDFSVPEVFVNEVKVGSKITVESTAYPTKNFTGTVYALNSAIDASTRMLDVRAKLPNADRKLLPGMSVQVLLYLAKPHETIIIPQTAVIYSVEGPYVYRVIDNKAIKTPIQLDEKLENNQVVVDKGLKAGDVIVTQGQEKIYFSGALLL